MKCENCMREVSSPDSHYYNGKEFQPGWNCVAFRVEHSDYVQGGATIWCSAEARKILRYDEAIRLLRVAKRSCGEMTFKKIEAFLAEELNR